MTTRTKAKVMALLAVYGAALVLNWFAYLSYRDSNVSKIAVSTWSDLEREFEVRGSSLRVKNREVLIVCFVGDYVYALKDTRHWFAADDTEFATSLRAAGGRTDPFNGEGKSSIVLLSHSSAVVLQFDWRTFYLANLGCANAEAGDIETWNWNPSITSGGVLYLPNATLEAPRGPGVPTPTECGEKLRRFIVAIDELLVENIGHTLRYDAAIAKYLPRKGCSVEEVISISNTSRFVMPLFDATTLDYTVSFANSNISVSFGLRKDSGDIEYPAASGRYPSL